MRTPIKISLAVVCISAITIWFIKNKKFAWDCGPIEVMGSTEGSWNAARDTFTIKLLDSNSYVILPGRKPTVIKQK